MGDNMGLAAVVVALSVIVVELGKVLVQKVSGKPKNGALSSKEQEALYRIDRTLLKTDNDGIPLTYFPRSFIEGQKELTLEIRSLSRVLERIENKIGNLPIH